MIGITIRYCSVLSNLVRCSLLIISTGVITVIPTATASSHDIPFLHAAQLAPDYWLARSKEPDQILRTPAQIAASNAQLLSTLPDMLDLAKAPDSYSQQELGALINQSSALPKAARFYADGRQLTPAHFARYQQAMALDALPASVQAAYALVTSRGIIRAFPTLDRVFNDGMDTDIDRFQETAVFPGQPLQVLHYSQDRLWAFVRHYHYSGWLQVKHLALTDKQTALNFANNPDFLLVTGARAHTNFTAEQPDVSEVALDMGVRLPLLRDFPALVHDQNPAFSYVVQLPVRRQDGTLQLLPALVARSQDVRTGFLPLTRANIIRQSFKFLGERYGWGHDYNARDCSGFIGEVFKTFGVLLPRNTSSLGKQRFAAEIQLDNASAAEKTLTLSQTDTGDLLLIPGHVMLVLGRADDGQLFVIHSVNGLSYFHSNGQYYQSKLNGVSITPLLPLQLNQHTSYLQALYNIKSLTRETYAHP
ncbi:C40 family peptidase [Rheinheimera tilapiae]|uniref:SH3 domain-containing protein n=1 Tax=Rheinheimera tilapiae TaxID=875043 RepID=A0ABV6BF02_9GAMM